MIDRNRKLRVGIVTFHRVINYGALLQAYALQATLRKMGCECVIVDYRNAMLEAIHKEMVLSDCRNIKDVARFLLYSNYHNAKLREFRDFSSAYLKVDHTCTNIEELKCIAPEYDTFICGSDQVWNSNITNFDKTYFLNFCEDPSKKNSYAASFGFDSIPEQFFGDYQALLRGFRHISVRERQAQKIVSDLIGKDAEVVLDPTMLITEKEWEKLAADCLQIKEYILVYSLGTSATMKTFVERLSAETGCRIVAVSYSLRKRMEAKYEKNTGPARFLSLFRNAQFVVTNSFHGTALSIVFNKEFFLEMLPEAQGVNSRLENILEIFDLRERQIRNGTNEHMRETINYGKVNEILHRERAKSLAFLQQVIQDAR